MAGQLVEPEAHRLRPAIRRVGQRSPRVDTHQQRIEDVLLHSERYLDGRAGQPDLVIVPYRHPRQESFSRFWRLGHSSRWDRAHSHPTLCGMQIDGCGADAVCLSGGQEQENVARHWRQQQVAQDSRSDSDRDNQGRTPDEQSAPRHSPTLLMTDSTRMPGVGEPGIVIAFVAGLISITSPCCLPLLPGYLGYLTGLGGEEPDRRRRTIAAASLFVVGFTAVFIALGATASELGAVLLYNRLPVARVAGVFIAVMGAFLLLEGRIGFFSRGGDWSRRLAGGSLWTAPLLGAAFAVTWTPCIGPVLGAVLTLAGTTASLSQGVLLLTAYSLGLGVPFLALGLSVVRVRRWLRSAGRITAALQPVSGALLVAMGVLLVTDQWLPLISPALTWYANAHWPPI